MLRGVCTRCLRQLHRGPLIRPLVRVSIHFFTSATAEATTTPSAFVDDDALIFQRVRRSSSAVP